MALFSRGKRNRDQSAETEVEAPAEQQAPDAPAPDAPAPEAVEATDAAAEASVGISVSSFRGVGAAPAEPAEPAPPAGPAPAGQLRMGREVAPPPSETVPGLRDNVLLAEALKALP